jgi:DNA-binding XRE family transcriptional regulator
VEGWTQEEMAEKIGVSRNTMSDWENGKADPYPTHVHALCKVFGKSAEELDLISRREVLALGAHVISKAAGMWTDDLLAQYKNGIEACQELYFAGSPHQVEVILPLYCRQTSQLAEQPSPISIPAARLASLAHHLTCELATDREDWLCRTIWPTGSSLCAKGFRHQLTSCCAH